VRIVGGSLGGRRFQPPAGLPARPTTDLAREALFNMLAHSLDWQGLNALDLFSGTGGVSYELL
jgi:16S rRNA G966 N2-methylase RsmD